MIRVYLLQVIREDNTDTVTGIDLIHHAILETTADPAIRKLIMDTTANEHSDFSASCQEWREATLEEVALYHSQVIIEPPNPDFVRARELLETSPQVITMPEIWELLRILGRLHGINP